MKKVWRAGRGVGALGEERGTFPTRLFGSHFHQEREKGRGKKCLNTGKAGCTRRESRDRGRRSAWQNRHTISARKEKTPPNYADVGKWNVRRKGLTLLPGEKRRWLPLGKGVQGRKGWVRHERIPEGNRTAVLEGGVIATKWKRSIKGGGHLWGQRRVAGRQKRAVQARQRSAESSEGTHPVTVAEEKAPHFCGKTAGKRDILVERKKRRRASPGRGQQLQSEGDESWVEASSCSQGGQSCVPKEKKA